MYDALVAAKNGDTQKVLVTGVHYLQPEVPKEVQDQYGEMEMGHGYLDLITLAGGHAADMAQVDRTKKSGKTGVITFAKQLGYLGQYTAQKMNYNGVFLCDPTTPGLDPHTINPTTVKIEIFETGKKKPLVAFSGQCVSDTQCTGDFAGAVTNKMHADGNGANAYYEFDVTTDLINKILLERGFQGGEARITFKTLGDPSRNAMIRHRAKIKTASK